MRLPKEYRFEGSEVFIENVDDKAILFPDPTSIKTFFENGDKCSNDFMNERDDAPPQTRDYFYTN